jgi:hypothetical protein
VFWKADKAGKRIKGEEIFFNETLARDEITELFDPKS